jgi:hypothetical protein
MPAATRSTGRPPLPEVPAWIVAHLERAWTPGDWAHLCRVADAWGLTPGQTLLCTLSHGLEAVERAPRRHRRAHVARSGSARQPTAERGRRR